MSTTSEKQTARSFRRHKVFGEVWAVVCLPDAKTSPIGGYRCTKPEEQTRGALPVLAMDMSPEMIEFLEDNAADMELWEPPLVPAEFLDQIVAAGRIADDAERRMKEKKTAADAAKKEWEAAAQDLQRLIHDAADEKAATPLFDGVE
jgi:hypothetical protein